MIFIAKHIKLRDGYTVYKKEIYFNGIKQNIEYPKTFKILGCYYCRDEKNIYSGDKKIVDVDSNTFTVLDWGYAKDNFRVHYYDKVIKGENSKSFEILPNDDYSKDSNSVYYLGKKINGSDSNTFILLEDGEAEDKNNY